MFPVRANNRAILPVLWRDPGTGNDTINLLAGNDRGYGLAGNDTLLGGAGNDTSAELEQSGPW